MVKNVWIVRDYITLKGGGWQEMSWVSGGENGDPEKE